MVTCAGTRLRLLAASLALVAAVGALACDGPGRDEERAAADPSSDRARVRELVEQVAVHLRAGESAAACRLMTRSARRQLASVVDRLADRGADHVARPAARTCSAGLAAVLSGDLLEDLSPRILSVTVAGDTATVVAKSTHDPSPQRASVRMERGRWRLAAWFAN